MIYAKSCQQSLMRGGKKIEFIVCTIIHMDFPNFIVEFFYDVEIGLYKEF